MELHPKEQLGWREAAESMLNRAVQSALSVEGTGFPHWADPDSGQWKVTDDGDWTGGALPGIFWLGYRMTGEEKILNLAREWSRRLGPRSRLETAFNGFGFYYGVALGDIILSDTTTVDIALEAAESLAGLFTPALGLIPLGRDAEEVGSTGRDFSSIDSLQASPLLFWAGTYTGKHRYIDIARRHTSRVLEIHSRSDGSIVQSTELNSESGMVVRRFTHKGYSDSSVWGRAQAWAMLFSVMAYARERDTDWLAQCIRAADWWVAHLPPDGVAYWDFDDPSIPDAPRDTAATSIACAALIRLAELASDAEQRHRYRQSAENSLRILVSAYLRSLGASAEYRQGQIKMLVGGCFNNRPDSRIQDKVSNAELIFGSYYLFECLQVMLGTIKANEL